MPSIWQYDVVKTPAFNMSAYARLFGRYAALAGVAALSTLPAASPGPRRHPALDAIPKVVLWAWERPEDMQWLPVGVGVAYLDTTIELADREARVRRRQHRMVAPDHAAVIPVVHVDVSRQHPPLRTDAQINSVVDAVLTAALHGNRHVVQLDFEVRSSQREFLSRTVSAIRQRLPRDYALSVTALASWCAGDYWLDHLDADEIVPMAFHMARDSLVIRALLDERGSFQQRRCRDAIGFATNEPPTWGTASRQYIFSPSPWTVDAWLLFSGRNNS